MAFCAVTRIDNEIEKLDAGIRQRRGRGLQTSNESPGKYARIRVVLVGVSGHYSLACGGLEDAFLQEFLQPFR